ncbi:response regulator transcription factor [Polynucleobacter sp. Ross1-W9]|uniref:response regulator transcription factor n=1 Tax=Polynucleobacter parvulilacunae TaxID=1855631 RepID=UPI001C0E66D6|nr:response regulator transcription factor [Polynucleobacter parvulilacunae]MBU3557843.1 response regulator transcription factor [Polynucleobacter parvulilacunae]
MTARILVVEDEIDFREGLVELLNLEGFAAQGAESIAEFQSSIQSNEFDIIILDRNLPDGDGLEALKHYKNPNDVGSIVLTCEGQPHDRIAGLNADADYYLVKPFPMNELLAIIHRLERRIKSSNNDLSQWMLDSVRWEIKTPNNLEIELTKNEFALLSCFINKPGATVARDEIIKGLGFNPLDYDNRRLEVMLRRLRKKIEDAGVVKFPLQTVYGAGLAFTETLKAS